MPTFAIMKTTKAPTVLTPITANEMNAMHVLGCFYGEATSTAVCFSQSVSNEES